MHRKRSVVREMKRLLKAASVLARPQEKAGRKAPIPAEKMRDRSRAHAWRKHAALLTAADAMGRIHKYIGADRPRRPDDLSDRTAMHPNERSRFERIMHRSLGSHNSRIVKTVLEEFHKDGCGSGSIPLAG